MGRPRFLAENLYSESQFADHTVTANEEATGHEAFRVATTRRTGLNFWSPTTANNDAWVEVACDQPRAADTVVIDRGHNLSGSEVKLQCSDDDFTTTETVFTETLPSTPSPVSPLSGGALTRDGAWAIHFDARVATYWRVLVSAMGADLTPEIRGLYLGLSWQPTLLIDRPYSPADHALSYEEVRGPTLWVGSGRVARRRERTHRVKLASFSELSHARYHTAGRLWRGHPAWVWADEDQGERGWLAKAAPGSHGWEHAQGWAFAQADLQLVEHAAEQVS